ncbi:hypothetical protein K1719_036825 [Acacia pycnantha]|nr:hypothetical protein K1719_036825 [Acacia pycnantha]
MAGLIAYFILFFNFSSKIYLSAGVTVDEKNWPPFFPIIHHDIANEIPAHAQRMQYLAFASWLGILLCLAVGLTKFSLL